MSTQLNETLFFTFRTFPWINQLPDPFVFGAIKQDLPKFIKLVDEVKPRRIIGVAKSKLPYSTVEAFAGNKFNQGVINKLGADKYDLDLLEADWLKVRNTPTTSFCNYVAYNLKEALYEGDTKVALIHIINSDLGRLLP